LEKHPDYSLNLKTICKNKTMLFYLLLYLLF